MFVFQEVSIRTEIFVMDSALLSAMITNFIVPNQLIQKQDVHKLQLVSTKPLISTVNSVLTNNVQLYALKLSFIAKVPVFYWVARKKTSV